MSFGDILIGVIFVLALGAGIGMTPAAETTNEFFWTKASYVIAALALAIGFFFWLFEEERHLAQRTILGSVVGMFIFVGIPELLSWVSSKEAAKHSSFGDAREKSSEGRTSEEPKPETAALLKSPPSTPGQGGKGGDTKVFGSNGIAVGGPGGKGGDGGGGEAHGDNAKVFGSEGGQAGQAGGQGGRGGRSGAELVVGVPNRQLLDGTWLWDYSRGRDESVSMQAPLFIECRRELLPTVHVRGDKMHSLFLSYSGEEVIDDTFQLSTWEYPAGTQDATSTFTGVAVFRCEITNYDKQSIFDVQIAMSIRYVEATMGNGVVSMNEHSIAHQATKKFKIPKIEPGSENRFVFYLLNGSEYFAQVQLPPNATYITADNSQRRVANFLPPSTDSKDNQLIFPPRVGPA
ncbi:MAG: hypothetical protein P4L83_17225 [Nevskia sp.]|nr:hypothetical protein [Nevskia sp.]